jgi:hypothetical protein
VLIGWEKEKWLNLNSDNVRQIMAKRLELAAEKGCDAVDPDNMDAYVGFHTAPIVFSARLIVQYRPTKMESK